MRASALGRDGAPDVHRVLHRAAARAPRPGCRPRTPAPRAAPTPRPRARSRRGARRPRAREARRGGHRRRPHRRRPRRAAVARHVLERGEPVAQTRGLAGQPDDDGPGERGAEPAPELPPRSRARDRRGAVARARQRLALGADRLRDARHRDGHRARPSRLTGLPDRAHRPGVEEDQPLGLYRRVDDGGEEGRRRRHRVERRRARRPRPARWDAAGRSASARTPSVPSEPTSSFGTS